MTGSLVSREQLRNLIEGTWEEVARWFIAKPRVFTLPHPEQQILFEYASRLRSAIRAACSQASWDRLYFDASSSSLGTGSVVHVVPRRPPLYIDTRKLYGLDDHGPRQVATPDAAVAVQVLRSAPELLDLDEDGRPRTQRWMPTSMRLQGWLLDEHVAQLEELSGAPCDGFLFVVYSNDARRVTTVDARDVASWASWHQPTTTLWWASRHFRARTRS